MLFWRRKGKETKDVEKEVPPKEEPRGEVPSLEKLQDKRQRKRLAVGAGLSPGA